MNEAIDSKLRGIEHIRTKIGVVDNLIKSVLHHGVYRKGQQLEVEESQHILEKLAGEVDAFLQETDKFFSNVNSILETGDIGVQTVEEVEEDVVQDESPETGNDDETVEEVSSEGAGELLQEESEDLKTEDNENVSSEGE